MMAALEQILHVFGRLDGAPVKWLELLELNIFNGISNWDSRDQRTLVANQLHKRLIANLAALDMACGDVQGHA
jgi:hypothetical protein